MFCPKCGTSNDDSARFCAKCGAALAAAEAPAAGTGAGTGTMRTSSAGSGGKVVTGKNPTVAMVMSIFLGWLGVRPVLQRRLEEGPGDGRRLDPARRPVRRTRHPGRLDLVGDRRLPGRERQVESLVSV